MRNRIIIVDTHEQSRTILANMLNTKYTVIETENTAQSLEQINREEKELAAILVDLTVAGTDEYALLRTFRQCRWNNAIPILLLCGDSSTIIDPRFFELGISECIHTPYDPNLIDKKLNNLIRLFEYQNTLEKQSETMQKQHRLLKLQSERLSKNNETIIDVLGDVVEYRNVESGEHIRRVKEYTKILATETMKRFPEYGLTPEKVSIIVAASPLHDIGKIALPDNILMKPGRLTDQEYEYIKSHTISGCEILENIKGVWSDEYAHISKEICRSHHERYDGAGYPDGLRGEEIPLSAQIVSIADVYDALTNERVYKDAIPKDRAFRMIINGECGVFSPKLMECLRNVRTEFEEVRCE